MTGNAEDFLSSAKKKGDISYSHLILVAMILVLLFLTVFQHLQILRLKKNIFGMMPGEKMPELAMISMDNIRFDSSAFSRGVTLLICFKTPCVSCNTNNGIWANFKRFYGDRIQVLGIIPDGNPASFQLQVEGKVNFSLYMPVDIPDFREKMRLRLNLEQTIVVYQNKVIAVKIGQLSPKDVQYLMAKINGVIKI